MRTPQEIKQALQMLDSLLDGDYFKPIIRGTAEQELAVLVMRDTLLWIQQRGNENIKNNLRRLTKLAQRVARQA